MFTKRPALTAWPKSILLAVALVPMIIVILLAFSWPALTATPHGVPIGVSGPKAAVESVVEQLEAQSDEVFEVTTVADRDALVDAIEQRSIVAGIVLGEEPELLTASAAGNVGQTANQLAGPLQAMLSGNGGNADSSVALQLKTTDVIPYSDSDPNGSRLGNAFFPLLLGGMIGGISLSLLVVGLMRRIIAGAVYSVAGGVVLTAILQGWFESIHGDVLLNFAAFSLAIGSITFAIIGCFSFIGKAGIAVGPVVMMLFANPISGATVPAQFLPGTWGLVGQWFPPGATATLVRNNSYFANADSSFQWAVLCGWVALGLALTALAAARPNPGDVDTAETAPPRAPYAVEQPGPEATAASDETAAPIPAR